MKKSLLSMMVLIAMQAAMAGTVTQDEAQRKAAKFLSGRTALARGSKATPQVSLACVNSNDACNSYYVFNVSGNNGFVIAGSDDLMPDVLGYADRGAFDPQNVPASMQAMLQSYDRQLAYLMLHPEAAAVRRTVTGSAVSPLLGATEWDQMEPYNDLCPLDGTMRSLTGCGATAMAQVLYYYKYPAQTTAEIPAYTTYTTGISVPAQPVATIDWVNMLPAYNGSETEAQKKAVAQLMALCGSAAQMNYSSGLSNSGIRNHEEALKKYFDFDAATITLSRENYRQAEWNQMVYDELKAHRPVIYCGQSTGGGHLFVVDGYDQDDYFHVNWGWSGASNGYFLLSVLNPGDNSGSGASSSTDGYSFDQEAIFGAQPNKGGAARPALSFGINLQSNTEFTRDGTDEDFDATVTVSYSNVCAYDGTFDGAVGIYDSTDKLVKTITLFTDEPIEALTPYGYYRMYQSLEFGASLPDGVYRLAGLQRKAGTSVWTPCDKPIYGTDHKSLYATISGNTLTLANPVVSLTGSVAIVGRSEVGSSVKVRATITNNSLLFNDLLFFYVGDQRSAGRHVDIAAGQTVSTDFTFTPETAGTYNVSIRRFEYPDYLSLFSGTVTITEPATNNLEITLSMPGREGYVVSSSKADVVLHVTNNGANTYNNVIGATIMASLADGNFDIKEMSKDIELAPAASTDVTFTLTNLKDGGDYDATFSYMSEGTRQIVCSDMFYTRYNHGTVPTVTRVGDNLYDITVDETSGTSAVINAGTADYPRAENLSYKRTLVASKDAYTVCLPYTPPTKGVKYYTLTGFDGKKTLTFTEITGAPMAFTPYLAVASEDVVLSGTETSVTLDNVVANSSAAGGYTLKGTVTGLHNREILFRDASLYYILQDGNKWQHMPQNTPTVYIPPFRAFIEGPTASSRLESTFADGQTTGIELLGTVDSDGTQRLFDLNGHRISEPAAKGVYISNGKKVMK